MNAGKMCLGDAVVVGLASALLTGDKWLPKDKKIIELISDKNTQEFPFFFCGLLDLGILFLFFS